MLLIPLLGAPKCDPSKNREMGGARALSCCQTLKNTITNQNTVLAVGGGCLTRDANKGDGNEGGGQATVTRAIVTATATATAMAWVIVMARRLAGDKEGKGKGDKSNGEGDDGGG
jgi:hypothetical protein